MTINSQKELFVSLLSHVRQGTERASKIYREFGQLAREPEIKEALEARAFVSEKSLASLDECFKLMNEQPVTLPGRLTEVFVEDFRKELAEIHSPEAKRLFILAKAHHLNNMRIGEYMVLIEAADTTGHYGVGVILESCLATKLAFVERTRRLIRTLMQMEPAGVR